MLLIQGQDCGLDLDGVESLIRRHEETEREVIVIQERSKVSQRVHLWSWSTAVHVTCNISPLSCLNPFSTMTIMTTSLVIGQALESEVSEQLRDGSVLTDKLKSKQKEVLKSLKTLEREGKVR